MNKGLYELPETYLDDDEYKKRDTYQQGRFSHEAEIQDIVKEGQRKENTSRE
jgi:hypothetical protein